MFHSTNTGIFAKFVCDQNRVHLEYDKSISDNKFWSDDWRVLHLFPNQSMWWCDTTCNNYGLKYILTRVLPKIHLYSVFGWRVSQPTQFEVTEEMFCKSFGHFAHYCQYYYCSIWRLLEIAKIVLTDILIWSNCKIWYSISKFKHHL